MRITVKLFALQFDICLPTIEFTSLCEMQMLNVARSRMLCLIEEIETSEVSDSVLALVCQARGVVAKFEMLKCISQSERQ